MNPENPNETVNPETAPAQPEATEAEVSELERLKGENELLQAELKAAKDKYIRLYAEFDNYRKRMAAELADAQRSGKFDAIRALLPTLDDLERALGFAQAKPEELLPGVKSVVENFRRNLESLGVEPVAGVGADFDPRYHEAIGAVDGEKDKVLHVYQQGFKYGEMLVRPARVVVGNGNAPEVEGQPMSANGN
ncbi:MAG TPA: nucleotide exchange factor GrpE [Meiothermus sp.]|nr:nucleotide exchange factor GrpE [Meiothermus sp.]